jgi:hypothetical protein
MTRAIFNVLYFFKGTVAFEVSMLGFFHDSIDPRIYFHMLNFFHPRRRIFRDISPLSFTKRI